MKISSPRDFEAVVLACKGVASTTLKSQTQNVASQGITSRELQRSIVCSHKLVL